MLPFLQEDCYDSVIAWFIQGLNKLISEEMASNRRRSFFDIAIDGRFVIRIDLSRLLV